MGDTACVTNYPKCDICKYEQGRTTEAHYDAKTTAGPWASLCDTHFASRGIGLGTGKGQRLIVGDEPVDTDEEKGRKIRQAINQGDFDTAEELIGDGDPAEWL